MQGNEIIGYLLLAIAVIACVIYIIWAILAILFAYYKKRAFLEKKEETGRLFADFALSLCLI